jgi:thioredoxin 1
VSPATEESARLKNPKEAFTHRQGMIEIETKQGLDAQLGKNPKLLVLFWASWCPFCRRFLPIFEAATADFNLGKIVHARIDDLENPLWEDYDIEAAPTAIYFVNGKVCSRLDSRLGLGLNEKQFKAWLKKLNKNEKRKE